MEHDVDYKFELEFPCINCPVFAICFNKDNIDEIAGCSKLKSYILEDLFDKIEIGRRVDEMSEIYKRHLEFHIEEIIMEELDEGSLDFTTHEAGITECYIIIDHSRSLETLIHTKYEFEE